jgi:hypothetical protein
MWQNRHARNQTRISKTQPSSRTITSTNRWPSRENWLTQSAPREVGIIRAYSSPMQVNFWGPLGCNNCINRGARLVQLACVCMRESVTRLSVEITLNIPLINIVNELQNSLETERRRRDLWLRTCQHRQCWMTRQPTEGRISRIPAMLATVRIRIGSLVWTGFSKIEMTINIRGLCQID